MKEGYRTKDQLTEELVEVYPGVLLLQLNGKRDNGSSQQLVEMMRERIVETNSLAVVVDVTRVPNIDTKLVRHLNNVISTVRLLDAQLILSGVRSSMSQKLMQVGADLSGTKTCFSLAVGLWAALDIVES